MSETKPSQGERPELEEALRALPRVEASEGFTQRVVEASRRREAVEGEPAGDWQELLVKAAAVLALCGAAMFAGWWWTGDAEGRASVALADPVVEAKALEIERLQNRMQTLQAELEELRRLAAEAQPIVPLGSSRVANGEPVDYYLDLRALRSVQPEAVRTNF